MEPEEKDKPERVGEAESAHHLLAEMVLGLTRPQVYLPVRSILRPKTELQRSSPRWRGEATLCFIRENTAVPSVSETSKH